MAESIRQNTDLCSLSLDACRLEDTSTIVISCRELDRLEHSEHLERFGGFVHLKVSEVEQSLRHPESSLVQLLKTLLSLCADLERIVVCGHGDCFEASPTRHRTEQYSSWERSLRGISLDDCIPLGLAADAGAETPETLVVSWLHALNQLFERGILEKRNEIKLLGWLYEPEWNWVSAYDSDVDLFVPISSHSQLGASELESEFY